MDEKSIMCPRCGRFMLKIKAKDEVLRKMKCRHCGKWIWFVAKTDYFEIHEVPKRTTASGKRFY